MITDGDLGRWFGYHPADAAQKVKYAAIEDKARELADMMVDLCPIGADTRQAVQLLRQSKMMAIASIACAPSAT